MSTPSEKLAQSLEILRKVQNSGSHAIKAADVSRVHRERLLKNGFLKEVIKGWYIASRPDEMSGDSTAWYAAYWHFAAFYLNDRFNDDWCLSPEQSLLRHVGNCTVPRQLLVRSPQATNKVTALPFDTSLLDARLNLPDSKNLEKVDGLWLYSIVSALINVTSKFFTQHPSEARAILLMQPEASAILALLLAGGHSTIAGRLAGAFRNIGKSEVANDIIETMRAAGFNVRETDPFDSQLTIDFSPRERSPYVNRMRIMWHEMRKEILNHFPISPTLSALPSDGDDYLRSVEEKYVSDAYHSLSIEGYRVTLELIERVRSGGWSPDHDENDHNHKNALAARGYWQAFQAVKQSIQKVLAHKSPGKVVAKDHGLWYREMFGPSITAGILKPADLAGYRSAPVYIRRSMHVPPRYEAVRDLMPAFFDLLSQETEPSVRIVLGHFFFVYIHPYMDGNGRMGRFLMNVMFASAGYPWTIVPVEQRKNYMASLEIASVEQDIIPFCKFIAALM